MHDAERAGTYDVGLVAVVVQVGEVGLDDLIRDELLARDESVERLLEMTAVAGKVSNVDAVDETL